MKLWQNIVTLGIVVTSLSAVAQSPTYKVQGGRKVYDVDSSRLVGGADSLLFADSIKKIDSAKLILATDTLPAKKSKYRFDLLRDTLSPGAALGLSFIPGLGQIYNRQWWKAPIFYTLIGGGVAGGVVYGNLAMQTNTLLQNAISSGASLEYANGLRRKMQRQNDASTIFYAVAGLTYLYSVADATFNYRGRMSHIRKATTLAALFPGAGFIYTKTYWRLPIYYGGFAVLGAVIDYNSRNYVRYKNAYDAVSSGVPDEFGGRYSADLLKNVRDSYRRDRDFGIIAIVAVYLLSVIDTYVIATLKNWDVSDDLNVSLEPTLFEERIGMKSSTPAGAGMSLKLKF